MKHWILIFIFVFVIPVVAYGEAGERIETDGYRLHISPTKLGSDLVVTCEIKGGNQTERLYVRIGLFDETGKAVSVKYLIKHYKNSNSFMLRKKNVSGGNRWKVSSVFLSN